jgi:hypothetical protein
MLKSIYSKLEDVPEPDRAHYAFQDGRYVLQLDSEHPVLVKNTDLLRQHSADKSTITKLTNEKAALEGTELPAGHVAIPAADAQLLTAYRTVGKPEDIQKAITERDELKTKLTTSARKELLRTVSEAEGWPLALLETAGAALELEMREVTEGDKKLQRAHVLVKDKDNRVEAKPFAEFAASDESLKQILPLVEAGRKIAPDGTQFIRQPAAGTPPANEDPIAKRLDARNQARTARPNPLMPKATATS